MYYEGKKACVSRRREEAKRVISFSRFFWWFQADCALISEMTPLYECTLRKSTNLWTTCKRNMLNLKFKWHRSRIQWIRLNCVRSKFIYYPSKLERALTHLNFIVFCIQLNVAISQKIEVREQIYQQNESFYMIIRLFLMESQK